MSNLASLLRISPQCDGWWVLCVNELRWSTTPWWVRWDSRRSARRVSRSSDCGKTLDRTRAWYSMKCVTDCTDERRIIIIITVIIFTVISLIIIHVKTRPYVTQSDTRTSCYMKSFTDSTEQRKPQSMTLSSNSSMSPLSILKQDSI